VKRLIRKKRRMLSVLLVCSMLLSGVSVFAAENETTSIGFNQQSYESAAVLNTAIAGESVFEGDVNETVSRGAFVKAVTEIFGVQPYGSATAVYKDVDEQNKYFNEINTAYEMGWISPAENFNPDQAILYPEALKIMFHAAHYEIFADVYGQYPSSYQKLASKLDIGDDVTINSDNTISVANAEIMLFNILHSSASKISGFNGSNPTYELGSETNLEYLYDILWFEGIVTSTGANSLLLDEGINKKDTTISIDGESFSSQWLDSSYLGKKVRAYYYTEDSGGLRICCVTEKHKTNDEKIISFTDFEEIKDSYLYYQEDGKRKKKLNLDSAYRVVYNGRRVSKLEDYMLENNLTDIRLISNDNDNDYEIIFIDGYTYGYVTGINNFEKTVGIKLPGQTLYLGQDDEKTVIEVYDGQGNNIELFELNNNVVVGIKQSADGYLCQIRVCENAVYGKVISVDRENNIISLSKKEYIDNHELDARYEDVVRQYKMSDSFVREFAEKIKMGDELSAITGMNGELVYLNSGVFNTVYGYLQKVFVSYDTGDEEYILKVLEMNGEFGKYRLSDRVTIDGSLKKSAAVYDIISRDFSPQVIKYSINNNGEINVIDFASTDISGFGQKPENSKDSLIKYYSRSSLRYRAGCRGFNSKALMLNAQILSVPNNTDLLDESENYSIGDYNTLVSDNTYTVDIYNIDEYGMAEFAVVYVDAKAPPSSRSFTSSIVCKVYNSYNDELGEVGRTVVCRDVTSFKSYFLPDDVTVNKTSGNDICSGDIVRVYEVDGIIREIFTDIDFSSGEPVFDSLHGASYDETGNASLVFVKGKMYSQGSSSYVLSDITHDGQTYDYSYESLRPYYATGNIVLFDTSSDEARNISKSELQTYQGYGDECDYVIIRQNYTSPSVMFVIR